MALSLLQNNLVLAQGQYWFSGSHLCGLASVLSYGKIPHEKNPHDDGAARSAFRKIGVMSTDTSRLPRPRAFCYAPRQRCRSQRESEVKACLAESVRMERLKCETEPIAEDGLRTLRVKAWIGHGSERMVRLYTHLRPQYRSRVLASIPSLVGCKVALIDPIDPLLRMEKVA